MGSSLILRLSELSASPPLRMDEKALRFLYPHKLLADILSKKRRNGFHDTHSVWVVSRGPVLQS